MTLIERIKRLFHIREKIDNDIEPIETTDVSIIDTSKLEIDRNLTDDENKKIRPEILFEGYRKNAEVEDDRENTAKSDDDIDLTFF